MVQSLASSEVTQTISKDPISIYLRCPEVKLSVSDIFKIDSCHFLHVSNDNISKTEAN